MVLLFGYCENEHSYVLVVVWNLLPSILCLFSLSESNYLLRSFLIIFISVLYLEGETEISE